MHGHPNAMGSPRNEENRRRSVITTFRTEQAAYAQRKLSMQPLVTPSIVVKSARSSQEGIRLENHHELHFKFTERIPSTKQLLNKIKVLPITNEPKQIELRKRQPRKSLNHKNQAKRTSIMQRTKSIRLLEEKVSFITKRRLFFKRVRQMMLYLFATSLFVGTGLYLSLMSDSSLTSCCAGKVITLAHGVRATAMALDSNGTLYIADAFGTRIYTYNGTLNEYAGATDYDDLDGNLTTARFAFPTGIAVDSIRGIIYVATRDSQNIRCIQDGEVTTLNWTRDEEPNTPISLPVYTVDDELEIYTPISVAVDTIGNLYIGSGGMIEKILPDGTVIVVAGISLRGYADGMSDTARFRYIRSLVVDAKNQFIYLADMYNRAIRRIDLIHGMVTTMTNIGFMNTNSGRCPDCYPFDRPMGIALDVNNTKIIVADSWNNSIIVFDINGTYLETYGTSEYGATDDLPPSVANPTGQNITFGNPCSLAVDTDGRIYVGDAGNRLIRQIIPWSD